MVYNSNIRNVSLIYLRGLEAAELKEEDMPMVYFHSPLFELCGRRHQTL